MDGKTLKGMLQNAINEASTSTFLDSRTSFDFIYEAALEYNRLTQALCSTQAITTIASTSGYNLNSDFLCTRLYNDRNELVVKYTDIATPTPNNSFVPFRPYEQIYQALNTTAADVPTNFSITDYETVGTNLIGAATTPTGSASEDMPLLTASAGAFIVNGVAIGDFIHNTTDLSDGIVLEVVSATQLRTVLFGGTTNFWTIADAYVIVPQGRKRLIVDPLSKTAGHMITMLYVQRPVPVYTNYGKYRFDTTAMFAIIKYAAWLYKYRDREPNFGDAFYKFWIAQVTSAVSATNKAFDRTRFRVNMIKRSLYDRSFR